MHIMYGYETSESDDESSNMEEETYYCTQGEQKRRRREIIGAMHIIPNGMDFNDGCILLDMLYTMRKDMGIDRSHSMSDVWRSLVRLYDTDSDNRIITLHLMGFDNGDDDGFLYCFNLPPIVERLQKLSIIVLEKCRSIPKELDNLAYLETLHFQSCATELFNENLPEGIQLASLKKIGLSASDFFPPPMFELITNHMHTLEKLDLWKGNEEHSKREFFMSNESQDFVYAIFQIEGRRSRESPL